MKELVVLWLVILIFSHFLKTVVERSVIVALKIGKNGLEARKLWPSDLKWGSHFYRKFSIEQLIAYSQTPQKIFKYYSIAFKVTR
jgi:hypothetical protein